MELAPGGGGGGGGGGWGGGGGLRLAQQKAERVRGKGEAIVRCYLFPFFLFVLGYAVDVGMKF